MQALLLPVGDDRYAVELTAVREVVRGPEITPLPGAPETILGVLNLRGDVVPVLDTAALLGIGRVQRPDFAVVADTEQGPAALAADATPATVALSAPSGSAELPAGAGRFTVGEEVVTLLDLAVLLAPERVGGS